MNLGALVFGKQLSGLINLVSANSKDDAEGSGTDFLSLEDVPAFVWFRIEMEGGLNSVHQLLLAILIVQILILLTMAYDSILWKLPTTVSRATVKVQGFNALSSSVLSNPEVLILGSHTRHKQIMLQVLSSIFIDIILERGRRRFNRSYSILTVNGWNKWCTKPLEERFLHGHHFLRGDSLENRLNLSLEGGNFPLEQNQRGGARRRAPCQMNTFPIDLHCLRPIIFIFVLRRFGHKVPNKRLGEILHLVSLDYLEKSDFTGVGGYLRDVAHVANVISLSKNLFLLKKRSKQALWFYSCHQNSKSFLLFLFCDFLAVIPFSDLFILDAKV